MNKNEYFAFISGLLLFEREDFSTEIFDFYLQEASSGINMSSPVTRTKVLSILSSFAKVNPLPLLQFLPKLQRMVGEEYWEL